MTNIKGQLGDEIAISYRNSSDLYTNDIYEERYPSILKTVKDVSTYGYTTNRKEVAKYQLVSKSVYKYEQAVFSNVENSFYGFKREWKDSYQTKTKLVRSLRESTTQLNLMEI